MLIPLLWPYHALLGNWSDSGPAGRSPVQEIIQPPCCGRTPQFIHRGASIDHVYVCELLEPNTKLATLIGILTKLRAAAGNRP